MRTSCSQPDPTGLTDATDATDAPGVETRSPQSIARDSLRAMSSRYYTLAQRVVLMGTSWQLFSHKHILVEISQPNMTRQEWSSARIVASRTFNPRWPLYLKHLFRACLQTYGAWSALMDADLEDPQTHRALIQADAAGQHQLQQACLRVPEGMRALEAYAGPLFDMWDQQNPGWALDPQLDQQQGCQPDQQPETTGEGK